MPSKTEEHVSNWARCRKHSDGKAILINFDRVASIAPIETQQGKRWTRVAFSGDLNNQVDILETIEQIDKILGHIHQLG
jgi:hypothetical protein